MPHSGIFHPLSCPQIDRQPSFSGLYLCVPILKLLSRCHVRLGWQKRLDQRTVQLFLWIRAGIGDDRHHVL